MKKINFQAGFAPLLVIAIVAILAVGGGAYVVTKSKEARVNLEGNADTQANANADANANANANLGTSSNIGANAKGSLRALLAMGKNTMCTFTSVNEGLSSSGTVYIASNGEMRGDFTSETSAGIYTGSMIVKSDYSYVWSGTQGIKMNTKNADTNANANAQAQQSLDLDAQVDYDCKDWSVDQSKLVVPSSVNFLDIEAMLKGSTLPSGVNLEGFMKVQGQ